MAFRASVRVAFAKVPAVDALVQSPPHGVGDDPVHLLLAGVG